jgi:hypothetical protein
MQQQYLHAALVRSPATGAIQPTTYNAFLELSDSEVEEKRLLQRLYDIRHVLYMR